MLDTKSPNSELFPPRKTAPSASNPWDVWASPSRSASANTKDVSASALPLAVTSTPSTQKKYGFQKNKRSQLLTITKQLALLVDTGVDISEALHVICAQLQPGPITQAWINIREDISTGKSLSAALHQQRDILGADIVAGISAGEASGKLSEVLLSTSAKLERELDLLSSLRSAIAYPCVLCVVAFGVVNALIWFVLPQFDKVFSNMSYEPPWITKFLLEGAQTIRRFYPGFVIGSVAFISLLIYTWKHPRFSIQRDKIMSRLPIIGRSYRYLATSNFLLLCGNMLRNGVPLLEALQLSARASYSPSLRSLLEEAEKEVLLGNSLSYTLSKSDFLPPGTSSMITMAEKSGSLDRVMVTTGEYFEKEGGQTLQQAFKLLEPILIVLMGGLVALVIASVMLPMMDANSAVK
jgi:type II secretory pathway component PulF